MRHIIQQTITRPGRKLPVRTPSRFRAYAAAGLAVVVAASLSACGNSSPLSSKSGSSSGPVVIGAANFYESDLLATIYHSVGIKPDTIVYNHLNQPRELVKGEVVSGLLR